MKRLRTLMLGAATVAIGLALAAPALADPSPAPVPPTPDSAIAQGTGGLAQFEGRTIDLSKGWGDAHDCIVSKDLPGGAECFRTRAEGDARMQSLRASRSAGSASVNVALASCLTPLQLFKDGLLSGDRLQFWDRGLQSLVPWGFNDKMSSFITGTCPTHLPDNSDGTGYWYPGNTSANHSEPILAAGWNDRVSAVWNY